MGEVFNRGRDNPPYGPVDPLLDFPRGGSLRELVDLAQRGGHFRRDRRLAGKRGVEGINCALTTTLEERDDTCADRARTAARAKRGKQIDLMLDDPDRSDEHGEAGD